MDKLANLKPFHENHSIKEAIITLFLSESLSEIESYTKLLKKGFEDVFSKAENIYSRKIVVSKTEFNTEDKQIVGFQFNKYTEEGEISLTLRGVSNSDNQSFLTISNLNYNSWSLFKKESIGIFKKLSEFVPYLKIEAFNLHFIDQFLWLSDEEQVPIKLIFSEKSDLLSKDFFESNNSFFVLNTEKKNNDLDFIHFDRIDIRVDNKVKIPISLSHNVAIPFDKAYELEYLLNSKKFSRRLDWAFEQNKILLGSLLTNPVLEKINLL